MNYSQNINSCFVCLRQAQSTSLEFTSLLDDGLNYCNLYDLLTGERALTPFLSSLWTHYVRK